MKFVRCLENEKHDSLVHDVCSLSFRNELVIYLNFGLSKNQGKRRTSFVDGPYISLRIFYIVRGCCVFFQLLRWIKCFMFKAKIFT